MVRDGRAPPHLAELTLGKNLLPRFQRSCAQFGVTVAYDREPGAANTVTFARCLLDRAQKNVGTTRVAFTAANRPHDAAHKAIIVQKIPGRRAQTKIKVKVIDAPALAALAPPPGGAVGVTPCHCEQPQARGLARPKAARPCAHSVHRHEALYC